MCLRAEQVRSEAGCARSGRPLGGRRRSGDQRSGDPGRLALVARALGATRGLTNTLGYAALPGVGWWSWRGCPPGCSAKSCGPGSTTTSAAGPPSFLGACTRPAASSLGAPPTSSLRWPLRDLGVVRIGGVGGGPSRHAEARSCGGEGRSGVSPWRWAVVEIPVTDKPAAAARMLGVQDRRPVTALGVKAPRHRRSGHRLVGEHHR